VANKRMTLPQCITLFPDSPNDPNDPQQGDGIITESEDELELWELRRKGLGLRDLLEPDGEDPAADPNDVPQHEDCDVLHSKMKAYTGLVFEYAKQTVESYGEEKTLEIQNWGRSPAPWRRASANLVESDRTKFVTRERIMKWIKYLLEHSYVKVGDTIYRQEIGVPMGTNCSPFLTNPTLFMFEFQSRSQGYDCGTYDKGKRSCAWPSALVTLMICGTHSWRKRHPDQ